MPAEAMRERVTAVLDALEAECEALGWSGDSRSSGGRQSDE